MNTKTEEENADSLVAYLDGEAFEYMSTISRKITPLTRRPNHSRKSRRHYWRSSLPRRQRQK